MSPDLPLNSTAPDGIDADLSALPAPPRRARTVAATLLSVAAIAAVAVLFAISGDVRYAFAPGQAIDLGELSHADLGGELADRLVRGRGAINLPSAISFERPFESDHFLLAPLPESRRLWVELRVPREADGRAAAPAASFAGRLTRLSDGWLRYRGLAAAARPGAVVPGPDAWVLVDGEVPSSCLWALPLAALLIAFAGYALVSVTRMLRPLRA